jgi:phospholipase A1
MLRTAGFFLAAALPLALHAQSAGPSWEACASVPDTTQRLACFDNWAKQQKAPGQPAPGAPLPAEAGKAAAEPPRRGIRLTSSDDCHEAGKSQMSRFWELEPGADCGTFGLRGYRPISLDLVGASSVNQQPTSENPNNNATVPTDYRHTEMRLSLSLRTKLAQGLFTYGDEGLDSLWVAYSQQSYWQLFTPKLSRPFRSTDHEPEVMYVRPLQSAQRGEWRLRVGAVGLVHQSNGQSQPLSRSWNRAYLMLGAEHDDIQVYGRVWRRIAETGGDDNPRISDFIGRGELSVRWNPSRDNIFVLTGRHSLKSEGHGSLRFEWFRTLADTGWGVPSGLRLHAAVFSGYGDTLLDYNRQRTVFSVGLSLVDW